MLHKEVVGRTAKRLQPTRGPVTMLEPSGNPYLSYLPGPEHPRVLDLFCGAGGLSLGFALAGFHISGGIDADAWAVQTHAYNFGGCDKPITLSETCTPEDALHKVGVNKVDVLVGGPPCQGFARVGRGKILSLVRTQLSEEELHNWEDPRNRLYLAYLEFVALLKPGWLVMENVPDMELHNDGGVVRSIFHDLTRMGYTVERFILDASAYGVPQTRRRLFIVANRFELPVVRPVPVTAGKPVTVRQAIGDLPVVRPEESADEMPYEGPPRTKYARSMRELLRGKDRRIVHDHVVRRYAGDDQEAFTYLEEGGRYRDLPGHLKRYREDVFDDKYQKLYWDKPSWTITAHIAKDGYRYIHPDRQQVRTLTVREAARIQSFPDWFRFSGFRSHKYRQIGNAVPPLLGKAIAEVVMAQVTAMERGGNA